MPCYCPIAAYQSPVGGPLRFKGARGDDRLIQIPCGRCIGCRLERSRQWAARIVCESQMHDRSCFLTLTYESAPISLSRRDCQLFIKRLRKHFACKLRYYLCGEYGERYQRPHYHCILFGEDFSADRRLFKVTPVGRLYVSDTLSAIWQLGHCLIGDVCFDSAAYCARYCVSKISGPLADQHYSGREPEFSLMSLKPGIGASWFSRYSSDVFPSDQLVVRGRPSKPPRYFDDLGDPLVVAECKDLRRLAAIHDSASRLLARQQFVERSLRTRREIKDLCYDG